MLELLNLLWKTWKHIITVRNSSCEKVMFLHPSVILFTGVGGECLSRPHPGQTATAAEGTHPTNAFLFCLEFFGVEFGYQVLILCFPTKMSLSYENDWFKIVHEIKFVRDPRKWLMCGKFQSVKEIV